MDLSMLKTQIMTMFMMKSASKPGETSTNDIFTILYTMMMMNLVEWAFRQVPVFMEYGRKYVEDRLAKKKDAWKPLIDAHNKQKQILTTVTLTRVYKEGEKANDRIDNVYVEKVDAVLDYICNLDNARHIRMDVRYSLNGSEEIELSPNLRAKIKTNGSNDQSSTEILLYSTVMKLGEIRAWIDEIHSAYVAEKNNKLGNKIFYFNELVTEPTVITDMSMKENPKQIYRWDNMPKMLTFTMNEFRTSKSFSNVYGHHVDELKERLDLFVNHPDWYFDRGIPYSLGIMLHGIPGAGKTSTIKAIARDTNRHIFNLSLRPYTTQRQLTNLFYNETVHVQNYDGGKQTLKIPLNKRVYVIEDIDCLTDVVLDRSITKEPLAANKEGEAVTLSFLLNLLDGVLETPGRILVITSNYPDKLDRAFVRPGRIDVRIEFKHADREFIQDMINKFYTTSLPIDQIPETIENQFTPAEVMESMCNNFKSPKGALEYLVKKLAQKKAKEEEMASGTRLEDLGFTLETVSQPSQPAHADSLEVDQSTPASLMAEPPKLVVLEEVAKTAETAKKEMPSETKPESEREPEPEKTDEPKKSEKIMPQDKTFCLMCENWYDQNNELAFEEHRFAACLRTPPKLLLPHDEMKKLPMPQKRFKFSMSWECDNDHNELQSTRCAICKLKMKEAEKAETIKIQKIMEQSALGFQDSSWDSAMFENAIMPEGAGGWVPGQPREGEQRSQIDLNQMSGR